MIYLLHFDRPLSHAKHYLGFSDAPEERIAEHRAGTGKCAKIMRALKLAGIGFKIAWIRPGDRNRERTLKARGKSRICPLCIAVATATKLGVEANR